MPGGSLPSLNGLSVPDAPYVPGSYGNSANALRLLNMNSRLEALARPSLVEEPSHFRRRFGAHRAQPRQLPPVQHDTPPATASTEWRPPREPLISEEGAVASCPICLTELREKNTDGTPSERTIQWTLCCGRVFHESCIACCLECPMCRHDLGLPNGRIRAAALSPVYPLYAAAKLSPTSLPQIYRVLYPPAQQSTDGARPAARVLRSPDGRRAERDREMARWLFND